MPEETTEPSIGLMPDTEEQPQIITTASPVKMADDADIWKTADDPVDEPVYEQAEPGIQGVGLSSQGVDPNPFPGELPQGMGDPLEGEFKRPALEAEANYQKERQQWLRSGDQKIHETIQNFDNFEPNEEPEVKELKIVQSLFKLDGVSEPQNSSDLEVKVGIYALKHYNKEVSDYRELYSLAKDRSDKRVKAEEVEDDLQGAALMGLMNVGGFSDWSKSQKGISEQRARSLQYKYNDYQKQARDKYKTEIDSVNTLVKVLKSDGINAMLDYAHKSKLDMSDEEYETFKSLFREVVLANPNTDMDDIINKAFNTDVELLRGAGNFLGKNLRNTARSWGAMWDMTTLPLKQLERNYGAPKGVKTKTILGSGFGMQHLNESSEDSRVREMRRLGIARRQAMINDLSSILKQDWAGIELNFERGGAGFWGGVEDKLGFIEENTYAMPSTLASMATYMIPAVGPGYTASMMYEAASNEYRTKLSDNGVPLSEAIKISEKLGMVATVPNLLLEKFQSMGLTNKMPFIRPAIDKINATVLRPYLRRGLSIGVGAGAEGLVELGQTAVTDIVQKLGAEFNEKIPGMDWKNGKNGVFDGLWTKYAASVIQVAPAGMGTMYSGISKDKRDKNLKDTPREIREILGYTKEANDEIDAAETIGEISNAARRGRETRNPYSESAQEAIDRHEAKLEAERRSFSNLQKNGIVPILRTDKTQPGVVEIVDPESGEILDRVDDARLAAESAISYMELKDQANQDQMDELVNFIEAAILDVQDTSKKEGKDQLELGSDIDVESILAMYPEYQKRAEVQIDRLEQLTDKEIVNGGDGGMSRAVYGVSVLDNEREQKGFLQRIFGGKTSAMTLVHERGHAKFREALDAGAITLKEAYDFFIKLDKGLAGKRSRKGEKLRFMPEGATETDYEIIDEAVAEFHEVMLLRTRNGKKTKMRDVVGKQISAMVKSRVPGATKFKAFYDAMLDFFGKLLARNFYMRQAVKQGLISEAEIDNFRAALQGTTEQEMLEADAESEASKILGDPFSIGERSSISPAQDADYLAAVEAGDTTKQQAMVDEAAKAAGYDSPKVYHGTERGKIDKIDRPLFLTVSRNEAQAYSELTDVDEFVVISKETSKEARVSIPDRFDGNGVADFQDYTGKPLVAEYNGNTGEIFYWDGETNGVGDKNIVIISDKLVESGDVVDGIGETKARPKPLVTPFVGSYYISGKFFDAGDSRFKEGDAPSSANLLGERLGANSKLVSEWKEFLAEGGYDAIKTTSDDARGVDQYVVFNPNQIKSADPVTYDSDGNVIPLSQRFDAGRDEIGFSIGDAEMKDTLYTMAYNRAKTPEKRLAIWGNFMERITDAKRELPKLIKAFGKEYEQAAIVDRRLMGDLRAEAAKMRREAIEEAENAMYDRYGEVLSNEDLVQLKSQPISQVVLAEGGIEHLASAKRRRNDEDLKDGGYDDSTGLPPIYYGGTQRPDQMAGQLFDEGLIRDDNVSTMVAAIDAEIITVSNRKQDLKEARKFINDARKVAKAESEAWLNERVAEQQRDYNPMERARRVLVMMNAMRMALPMELRGKISGDATLINIKSDEKRLEYLSKKLEKMDEVIESWIKKETTKEIEASFKRVLKLDPNSKVGKSNKTVAEIHQQIKDIKKISKMSKDAVDKRLNEIMVKIEKTEDEAEKQVLDLEMVNLVGYGGMKDMSAMQLTTYLENVLSLEKKGMVLRELKDQAFSDKVNGYRDFTNDEVTGGEGLMPPSKSSARVHYSKRSKIGKIGLDLKNFHAHNLSFEWVLNGLSRRAKDTKTLGGKIHNTFARMVHVATHNEKVANMKTNQDYDRFIGSVFGVKGSMALGNAIDSRLLTKHKTGINRKWYKEGGRAKVNKSMNASNIKAIIDGRADAEKLGLTEAEVESAKKDYYEKLTAKQAQKNMKGKVATLNGNTKINYESAIEGLDDELFISQSQAIAYTMMYRQEGMRESMIMEGYTEETMANLEENFLTKESKLIRDWMADKYEKNYDVVNAVFKEMNGVNLPMVDFYSPLKRIVDGKSEDITIDGLGNPALTTSPSFTFGRVKNFAEMDREADALTIFNRHMIQTNHYVAWAQTIKELRAVFGDKNVRQNIRDYVGEGIVEIIDTRINNMADGGKKLSTQWAPLDKFRLAHTFTSLSYNIGVGIKQLTSVPAFAFDMGGANFVKYQARFFDNFQENLKEMWETDYVQTRFKEGYERDVKDALRMVGQSKSQRVALSLMQKGMMVGKLGDIMPVIAGGWAAKHHAYDEFRRANPNSTKAEAEAHSMIVFEMASDRYQQAVDQKDLSTFQGEGSLSKLFVMYLTSPNQYYAGVYESVLDWKAGRKGGRERAIRSIVIGHIILPTMFQLATDLWREVTDDDHEWEANEYFRAMLLGPLNGLFLAGYALSPLAAVITGSKVWAPNTPLTDTMQDLVYSWQKMSNGDFSSGVDLLLDAAGQAYPTPLSFYPIIKRRLKPFYD